MEKELKPCPFCGGAASNIAWKNVNGEIRYSAFCTKCNVTQSIYYKTEKEMIEAWNRRISK